MRHLVQKLLLIAVSFFNITSVSAQTQQRPEEPAIWQYEVHKIAEGKYQLVFKLKLQQGWHIWAMDPGGDGLQIAPEFNFEMAEDVRLDGEIEEKGKKHSGPMEGVDGEVNYFDNNVTYIQVVSSKGKRTISGTHVYQICNDRMCLPPTEKSFSFYIKP